jgi:23S rRNA (guanine745-N1)-methyltransferase
MINTVLAALRCPICRTPLHEDAARPRPDPDRIRDSAEILRQDPRDNADPGASIRDESAAASGDEHAASMRDEPAAIIRGNPALLTEYRPDRGSDRGVRCERGHAFDRARQGYVHLGTGRKLPAGDTAEMVAARVRFLEAGHYEPLRMAIAEATPKDAGLIVDVGAGPGYYLSAALGSARNAAGLALDVSKAALRRAARCHERAEAVLADAWRELPLRDKSADVLLNVFAPRNGTEFARVITKVLIVVTPREDHLQELRAEHGLLDVDPAKDERLSQALQAFEAVDSRDLTWPLDLTAEDAQALVGMGPNAFHRRTTARKTTTRASVRVTTYVERSISSQPSGGS